MFGTTQDPRKAAASAHASAHEARNNGTYAQLSEIQAVLRKDLLSGDLKPIEAAQLTRAFVEAEKLKRIIKGQPANTSQSIREPREKKSSKSSASPLERLTVEGAILPDCRPMSSPDQKNA